MNLREVVFDDANLIHLSGGPTVGSCELRGSIKGGELN